MRDATSALRGRRWAAVMGATILGVTSLASCVSSRPFEGAGRDPLPESPAATVQLPAPPAAAEGMTRETPAALLRGETEIDLGTVVDIALTNSPLTRASWLEARSAAARFGAERADYWPTAEVTADAIRSRAVAGDASSAVGTSWGPAVAVDYLLFDLSRGARVGEARAALLAVDWSHNATVQSVVLMTLQAYYAYQNVRGQREAAAASLKTAEVALDAATLRHQVGLATRAEVLFATTARSRARLDYEALDGEYAAARGVLATALSLPASTPLDVGPLPSEVPVDTVVGSVERLVAGALAVRPDLAAARVEAEKARIHVDAVRGEAWPVLSLSGAAGRRSFRTVADTTHADTWSAGLFLTLPLFTGFAHTYDVKQAQADAGAAEARARSLEQRVDLEVWTAYYALQTASQRVRTSHDLLASATESEEVALARYREGVGTLIDLLLAQSALANARAQDVAARADFLSALAALGYATGKLDLAGVRDFAPATMVLTTPASTASPTQER